MLRRFAVLATGFALLAAAPAEARFGKRSSSGSSSSSSWSGSSTHSATGNYGGSQGGSTGYSSGYSGSGSRGYRYYPGWSLWAGAFVPHYYGAYSAGPAPVTSLAVAEPPEEEQPLRVVAGIEAHGYVNGITLAAHASVEGDRWGFFVTGQNSALRADDGSGSWDNIQLVSAHLGFAFLRGPYGRLRVEGGADAAFAPNMISIGPTVGVSGALYVGGPFALESDLMWTPWPFTQLEFRAGGALGLGPVGLRAGLRAQLLNDNGLVDGVAHQDLLLGPYVGVSYVF